MFEKKSLLPEWKHDYIFALNGAPYSGKDTLGQLLLEEISKQAQTDRNNNNDQQ